MLECDLYFLFFYWCVKIYTIFIYFFYVNLFQRVFGKNTWYIFYTLYCRHCIEVYQNCVLYLFLDLFFYDIFEWDSWIFFFVYIENLENIFFFLMELVKSVYLCFWHFITRVIDQPKIKSVGGSVVLFYNF